MPGAYQHAAYASLRAIENRRWVVQCANGGISLIVRPNGVVDLETELFTERMLTGTIHLRADESFYVRWGDIFGIATVIGTIVLILFAYVRSRTERKNHA
jgi:apolipoprotein N-acyltransferase